MSPEGGQLQFIDLSTQYTSTVSMQVNQRNIVSTTYGDQSSFVSVSAYGMTQDQSKLVTLEKLSDPKT